MQIYRIILFTLINWSFCFGQDGSDINYFKVNAVDSSLVGRDVHFDFYNRSFGGRIVDTIRINIDQKVVKFVEVRKDNGHNNWFSEQSLQSVAKSNEKTMVISKFRLDSITANSFTVTMFIQNADFFNKRPLDLVRQIQYRFEKEDVVEVLVKSNGL
jgi:hypothetical protein